MKTNLMVFFVVVAGFFFNLFGQYRVTIRIGEITISNPIPEEHEWKCILSTDIFTINGDLIQSPSGTTFYWEQDLCDGNGFTYWTYNDWLTGVCFFNRYSPVYICGDGVKVYENNQWSVINLPNYFTEAIRGDNYNNIVVVGDFGFASHFNGLSWHTLDELSGQGGFTSVAVKRGMVVICGHNSAGGIVGNL
jgi:hypothetical protein